MSDKIVLTRGISGHRHGIFLSGKIVLMRNVSSVGLAALHCNFIRLATL